MPGRGRDATHLNLAVRARGLALLVLAIPVVVLGDRVSVLALGSLALVWAAATAADRVAPGRLLVPILEGTLVGGIAALTIPQEAGVLGALAVPAFTAGLRGGVRFVSLALSAEIIALVGVHWARVGPLTAAEATDALVWIVTGLGLGFIASYLRSEAQRLIDDPLTPYRDAQRLIRQLLSLSGDLGSGLDPATLGTRIAVAVRNELPVAAIAVHVYRGDHLTPLVAGSSSSAVDQAELEPLALEAWDEQRQLVQGSAFALPLVTNSGPVAVITALLPSTFGMAGNDEGLRSRLGDLRSSLAPLAVQLDTAMLFTRLRDAATAEERRRLAREMHDGVAQDIASLGYLVDALAAAPASDAQAEQLRRLRDRITGVVSQVRISVQTLRTDVQASESLGAAISGLARPLSESSGIPIRVTVNERTARLRPEVEAELLRIAQEAMNNAVRHSSASEIDVSCRVAAPTAEIVVRDDGTGLGTGRPDSYGLAIMRERASLIDADLSIATVEPHGTVVTVRVPSRHAGSSPARDPRPDKVTA
jgi:signal transduction histidine kinase